MSRLCENLANKFTCLTAEADVNAVTAMLSVQELITEDALGQGDVWCGAAHGALLQAVRRRTSPFGSQH